MFKNLELPLDYKPEFDSLRKLLLEIAPERLWIACSARLSNAWPNGPMP